MVFSGGVWQTEGGGKKTVGRETKTVGGETKTVGRGGTKTIGGEQKKMWRIYVWLKDSRRRRRRRSTVLFKVQFNLVIYWLFKPHCQSTNTLSISHTLKFLPLIMIVKEEDGVNADN